MRHILLVVLLISLIIPPASAQTGKKGLNAFWKIPFLPLALHVGSDGVELSADTSVATPQGEPSGWR